ncbi:MAG: LSU ribosomal protein L34p, partial [uncultured Acetobacteraceae bacterium]
EAYLPALQARPEAPARLPLPHGDRGRPQRARRAARQGPEEAERL